MPLFKNFRPDWLSSGASILNFSLNLILPGLIMLEGRLAFTPELKTGLERIDVLAGYYWSFEANLIYSGASLGIPPLG
jgi:hypothetical protein